MKNTLIRPTAVSMAASGTTSWVDLGEYGGITIHIVSPATGAPAGKFFLDGSDDPTLAKAVPGTPAVVDAGKYAVDGGSNNVVGGAAVSGAYNQLWYTARPYPRWLRVRWARTSGGTGATFTATFSGKC